MRSSTGMRNAFGSVLALILFCAMALSGCETRERTDLTASVPETVTSDAGTAQQTEAANPANAAPAPGTLLESGSGVNDHYYADVSYWGMASDVTDSTFVLGKDAMAFHGSEPVPGWVVIHYSESTAVRMSVIRGDNYEIYAATRDDLQRYGGDVNYIFDVILEEPDAEELWAKEIRIAYRPSD